MILYLDTTTSYLYAALFENNKLIDSINVLLNKDLSENTLFMLNEMINNNGKSIEDIKKIIIVNGPGSFTGIRIGLTISKTLAWAKNIPIVAISSLKAMSLSIIDDYDYVVPVIDARRDYYYASIYDKKTGLNVLKDQYISKNALDVAIDNLPGSKVIVSNDDIKLEYEIKKYKPKFENIINNTMNNEESNPYYLDALYLKKTEAEENLNK